MDGDGALTGVFSYLGWAFLPNLVTSFLQNLLYRLTRRAGSPRPQPGQTLYAQHRRRVHIFVLCIYLVYVLLQTLHDIRLAGDFYAALGVSPAAADREIKAKFRRLAARFHPDKVRPGSDGTINGDADSAFVHLKLAHDTLLDPARRFAYDRFGPDIVRVQLPGLKTNRDYVYAGIRSLVPEYTKGGLMLMVLNYFWLPKWGQFWRYLAIMTLAFLELFFLTHEWHPPSLSSRFAGLVQWLAPGIFPQHLLPFQILTLARRMSISLNIFISQLAPQARPGPEEQDHQLQAQMSYLNQLAGRVDAEATELLGLGLAPYKGHKEHTQALKKGMKEGMVTSAIRNHPEVKAAVARVLERRNKEDR